MDNRTNRSIRHRLWTFCILVALYSARWLYDGAKKFSLLFRSRYLVDRATLGIRRFDYPYTCKSTYLLFYWWPNSSLKWEWLVTMNCNLICIFFKSGRMLGNLFEVADLHNCRLKPIQILPPLPTSTIGFHTQLCRL